MVAPSSPDAPETGRRASIRRVSAGLPAEARRRLLSCRRNRGRARYDPRMPAKPVADFLKARAVFSGLPAEELDALAAVAREHRYAAREYLFAEGDAPAWFWLVRSGRIKVLRQSRDGKEVVLELLGPGEPFGGVAALEGRPYPASAQAMEASTVVRIPPEPIAALARRHPAIVSELMRMLGRRLRGAHGTVTSLATDPVETRLAARSLRPSIRMSSLT